MLTQVCKNGKFWFNLKFVFYLLFLILISKYTKKDLRKQAFYELFYIYFTNIFPLILRPNNKLWS